MNSLFLCACVTYCQLQKCKSIKKENLSCLSFQLLNFKKIVKMFCRKCESNEESFASHRLRLCRPLA